MPPSPPPFGSRSATGDSAPTDRFDDGPGAGAFGHDSVERGSFGRDSLEHDSVERGSFGHHSFGRGSVAGAFFDDGSSNDHYFEDNDGERFIVGRPDWVDSVQLASSAAGTVPVSFPAEVPVAFVPTDEARKATDTIRRVTATGEDLADFGMLTPFVTDPEVTDVFVNGIAGVWVDRGAGAVRHPLPELDELVLRQLAVRLIARGGRHIDETTPCVDVRLHDGIRVHAVLPPISTSGTLLSIRLPRVTRLSLADLDEAGFFTKVSLATVRSLVARRQNVLITGAGGSGKTTLLAAMLSDSPATDRIIAIEDVAELRVAHPHFISLEARQANLEGAGQVGLERLVREALRMRPDRLVLGECRGAEIRELLAALNTGHDGGAGTVHANSLADVPARMEALGALASMSPSAIARQTVSAIGMVMHLEHTRSGRFLAQMGRFELDSSDRLRMVVLDA